MAEEDKYSGRQRSNTKVSGTAIIKILSAEVSDFMLQVRVMESQSLF